jgi:alpha-galactosidase
MRRLIQRIFCVAVCLWGGLGPVHAQGTPDDAAILRGVETPANAVRLETLDLSRMTAGWGQPQAGKSCEQKPLTLGGVVYPHGVGTHAVSEAMIDLKGAATRFMAMVGLDDERKGQGSITFEVWADDRKLADTGVMRGGDPPKLLSVDLTGRARLLLVVTDAGDGVANDHADWAGAMLLLKPGATEKPQTMTLPVEPPPAIHSGSSPVPAIHGPRVVGATPGRPFLFLIPATGQPPLAYAAKNLPPGLALDPKTGILAGSIQQAGTYVAELAVRGPRGIGKRRLKIVAGERKLALTPPMGWNSWYVWFGAVDQEKMKQAADWMVKSGLAAHGFQYADIDDCWEGRRDANGEIIPNEKFPDMKALGDYIHSKGLRFGIYSSPGPKTCGGYEGSYGHEEQDAQTYAKWGVDFFKYDWCSYGDVATGEGLDRLQKPYRVMREALDRCGRDIVYNLCQYGMGEVWKWGAEVGANTWRTTGDSGDTWGTVSSIGFGQDGLEKFAGPGRWNDPDYLQIGKLGGPNLRPTRLTPNEQITQVTLWSLLAAPLFLSCDLSQLDRFTLDLVTNDEVLDVDQDPLGKAAGRKAKREMTEVWARPLFDGTTAVGLFNRGMLRGRVTVNWPEIGVRGAQPVRDLWRQKNLGVFRDSFTAEIPAHGAMLLKIGRPLQKE